MQRVSKVDINNDKVMEFLYLLFPVPSNQHRTEEEIIVMEKRMKWNNPAVGFPGLFVGIDNLLYWYTNSADTRSLVIGGICAIAAVFWIL